MMEGWHNRVIAFGLKLDGTPNEVTEGHRQLGPFPLYRPSTLVREFVMYSAANFAIHKVAQL